MAKKRRRSKISRKAIGDEEKERQVQHLQHTDRKDGDDDDEVDHDDEVSDHNDNSSSSSPSSSKGDADSSDLSAGTAEDDESSDDTGAGSSAVDWNEDVELVDGFLTNRAFHELDLCEPLKRGIKDLKYHNMSEIQAKAIPPLLAGHDLLAQAKTGSGKTLAFLVPAIELLYRAEFKPRNGTGVIVLAPTRELAIQIYSVAQELMRYMTQTHTIVMGGSKKEWEEVRLEKGANLVVATPGRLLDHLLNTRFNFRNLITLVIDEADRILEVGFEDELRAIVKLLPRDKRQTSLFSATQTTRVADVARVSLNRSPVSVGVSGGTDDDEDGEMMSTVAKLEQGYVVVEAARKFLLLYSFLKRNRRRKVIVFFSTCNSVKFYTQLLNTVNIPVAGLHGQQKQSLRTNTFFQFCNTKEGILLATDVAARGLDIPDVDWIVQYDPPSNPKEYIHRVGRTARAGRKGKALMLLMPNERGFLRHLKHAGVPLNELEYPEKHLANIQSKLEKITTTNYALYKSATDAFRSFIYSYAAHNLKDIFNFKTLDVEGLAKAFGLTATPHVDLRAIETSISRKVGGRSGSKRKENTKKWIHVSMKRQKTG